mmetsp:Transcript_40557/g.115589  ORF Transcript_40557/g.115589 Transcript_40557/m.115589 type:complete len:110 (+) Transcript_40557:1841-2170(+)
MPYRTALTRCAAANSLTTARNTTMSAISTLCLASLSAAASGPSHPQQHKGDRTRHQGCEVSGPPAVILGRARHLEACQPLKSGWQIPSQGELLVASPTWGVSENKGRLE